MSDFVIIEIVLKKIEHLMKTRNILEEKLSFGVAVNIYIIISMKVKLSHGMNHARDNKA